ncbi:MAG: hypothetical protein OXH36_04510, partial [Bdellovibrionales bacterium]|nr:hypothetical protein [Bdellovibrionales bacterium]
ARRPADDIASLPDSGLSHAPTYLTRYKVVNKGLAALGEPTYATFGDYADDAPITDAEMRGTSLIWALEMKENGIFEDDGFSGQILDVCTADPCSALNNPENLKTNEVIRGIINHYRFVGSYIATKE